MVKIDFLFIKQVLFFFWMYNYVGYSDEVMWMRIKVVEREKSDGFKVRQNYQDLLIDWMWEVRKEGGIKNDYLMYSMSSCVDKSIF